MLFQLPLPLNLEMYSYRKWAEEETAPISTCGRGHWISSAHGSYLPFAQVCPPCLPLIGPASLCPPDSFLSGSSCSSWTPGSLPNPLLAASTWPALPSQLNLLVLMLQRTNQPFKWHKIKYEIYIVSLD